MKAGIKHHRKLQRFLGRLILRLPKRLLIKMSGGKRVVIDGRTLNPETQFAMYAAQERTPIHKLSVPVARRQLEIASKILAGRPRLMADIDHRLIPKPTGEIPTRIYTPRRLGQGAGALVYFHGGGWVTGSLESHDDLCRLFAARIKCKVISVDYRLAPEFKFPAGLNDAFNTYCWVREHASELAVNPERVAVGGDSAGGNLAAALCLLARKERAPMPKAQVLIYPVLDLRARGRSYRSYAEGFVLTEAGMNWFIRHYLEDPADIQNPLASPLLAENPEGLPPAIITTAGFDPLHDEGEAYAARLQKANVAVHYTSYDSLTHGYAAMTGVIKEARRAVLDTITRLQIFLQT